MRAGPSGEERFTPHYTVPVSPQCPQEISLLTLPVFQGAAVSSERFSQSLPPRNVAELGGSPPLRGSLEQLDRPSPAGPPLQGTELAALSTPETSLERLVPLVDYSAAWKLLPNVSRWAGSGNGTRSEHSPEGGDHRGGPCSRQRVRVLQPYFIVPGERGCVRLRSKLTEPLSHTTEVQKALFKHVSHTRSEDWWSRAI